MEGLPEELEFELEALRATYGDEAVCVEPAGSSAVAAAAVVSLPVAPRTEAEHECFVAGRLVMQVGEGYPGEPPAVQLTDAKGAAGRGRCLRCACACCGLACCFAPAIRTHALHAVCAGTCQPGVPHCAASPALLACRPQA